MAENVHITGADVDWASESTMRGLLNESKSQGAQYNAMIRLLGTMAGQTAHSKALSEMSTELKRLRGDIKTGNTKDSVSDRKEGAADTKRNASLERAERKLAKLDDTLGKGLKRLGYNITQILPTSLGKKLGDWTRGRAEKSLRSEEQQKSDREEDTLAGLLGGGKLGKLVKGVGAAAVAITAVGKMAHNQYTKFREEVDVRYDLGNEFKQTGLFTHIDDVGINFQSLANAINDNAMSLEQAAAMAQKFSQTVGVVGVKNTLKFANSLLDVEKPGNYVEKFGMTADQVTDMMGTYLETQRQIGTLRGMDDTRMKQGMDDFMTAVVSTSNSLKISLDEAAQMISQTFDRDDFAAMMATTRTDLDPELQASIGAMAASFGPVGEIIAMGALDPSRFALTDQFQQLQDPSLVPVRNILFEMMDSMRGGSTAGELQAEYGGQIADILQNSDFMHVMAAMDPQSQALIHSMVKLTQTTEDADKGFQQTDQGKAMSKQLETQRRIAVATENLSTKMVGAFDVSTNMEKLADANMSLVNTLTELPEKTNFHKLAADLGQAGIDIEANLKNGLSEGADLLIDKLFGRETDVSADAEIRAATPVIEHTAMGSELTAGAYRNSAELFLKIADPEGMSGVSSEESRTRMKDSLLESFKNQSLEHNQQLMVTMKNILEKQMDFAKGTNNEKQMQDIEALIGTWNVTAANISDLTKKLDR